jgi:hypothetical protein
MEPGPSELSSLRTAWPVGSGVGHGAMSLVLRLVAQVFNNVALRTPEFLSMMRSQGHCWVAAGYDALSDFMQ